MKIAIVNTWLSGGASKAAQRLYNGFLGLDSNHKYSFYIKNSKNKQFSIVPNAITLEHYTLTEKILNKLKIIKRDKALVELKQFRRSLGLDYYSGINNRLKLGSNKELKIAEVINLHWVAEMLDYKSFFANYKQPIFWTLHDQSPFLYGEHYDEVYSIDNLGVVFNREKTKIEIEWESRVKEKKMEIFESVNNLQIVAPSSWMVLSAGNSSLFKNFKIHYVPYGLNTCIFRKLDRLLSKEIFGLPKDKKIILFVSENLEVNRKGLKVLLRSLTLLDEKEVAIAVVGEGNFFIPGELKNIPVYYLGTIIEERLMSIVYNAADLFVIPSLIDNLPNTAIEAICCGTPVIGFKTGGIPDIIEHGINGMLADKINAESLAVRIASALQNLDSFDSEKISADAREKYKQEKQARAYLELFEKCH
jgi:glycosyltransferase involved in cell wall biosynthesis